MQSAALVPYILPSIVVGVPIGAYLIQRIRPETFRRICMSFDAWVVAFGLSTLLKDLRLVESNAAYLVMVVVGILDTWLLYRFFAVQLPMVKQIEALSGNEVRSAYVTPGLKDRPGLHSPLSSNVAADRARIV